MALPTTTILTALRAVAEQTRLRIVALLRHGELTVSDLTDILGQSQPRISRHLKLLTEAGVVERHREGTWVFFDLTSEGGVAELVTGVLACADDHDGVLNADLDRLASVRARRGAAAQDYFAAIADRWHEVRSLHAADEVVEAAIADLVGDHEYRSLLDLGTGTGRMLELLAGEQVRRAVGLDNSHSMLAVARDRLERAELRGIDLRQGDVYSPPFERDAFDLIVIHQVLHFLDDPARAVREAANLLAPGGRMLIVDFAPHSLEFLRTDHSHRRLGFRADTVAGWLDQSGLDVDPIREVAPARPAGDGDGDGLTVSLWLGRDRRPAATTHEPTSRREVVAT
jgi:ArsR family transcriptional regulator